MPGSAGKQNGGYNKDKCSYVKLDPTLSKLLASVFPSEKWGDNNNSSVKVGESYISF